MSRLHPLKIWLIPFLVLCLQPCFAQDKVSLSFLSFPISPVPVKVQLLLGEGKLLDIEAPTDWLSPPAQVTAMPAWVVGETVNGPDGKPVFKELGRTTAPASPQQMLLLIRKGKDNAAGFDLIVLDSR